MKTVLIGKLVGLPGPLAMVLVLAILACYSGGQVGVSAPEFRSIAGWINSEPLTMEGLRGKVVLLDFWTYTCVNCIRTMPYLKDWHAKYAERGLVIVGVHSPEFEFEKDRGNVVEASQRFGLEYPIAQDNNFGTWRAYDNQFWPAKYLVDQEGKVQYTHFGEGAYRETERKIRNLLEESGADLSDVEFGSAARPEFDPRARAGSSEERITREIYGGFRRNKVFGGQYVAHDEYYKKVERLVDYRDPGDHQNHSLYLQGPWLNGIESLRHARTTQNYEDYIALRFVATSVNAVIHPPGDGTFEVQVTLDGRPLRAQEAGADLVVTDDRSYFPVDESRMYEVVSLPEYGSHELKFSSNSDEFALFALTFGAYAQGP